MNYLDFDLITSVAELLTLVVMAAALHNEWAGTMVIYVGDNLNVQRWVETRQAHNVFARYLLRVLGAIEAV
eukprot:2563352-Heterocapsa_arctica.AAC.1